MPDYAPDEQVIYTTKRHWAILIPPAFFVILGLCCSLLTIIGATTDPPPGQPPPPDQALFCLGGCTTLIFAAGLFGTVRAFSKFLNSEFTLTNRRMIAQEGIFNRNYSDIPLRQIDNVFVRIPFWGNTLGYGTLEISSTRATQPLNYVAGASRLRQLIQEQITKS